MAGKSGNRALRERRIMIYGGGSNHNNGEYEVFRKRDFRYWVAGVITSGTLRVTHGGQSEIIRAPHFILTEPGIVCHLQSADGGDWDEMWILFLPPEHWGPLLRLSSVFPGFWAATLEGTGHGQDVIELMRDSLGHFKSARRPEDEWLAGNALEKALIFVHADSVMEQCGDQRIEETIRHMREHMAEHLTVAGLARRVHLSESRLAHLFQDMTGISPLKFLERERMKEAQTLLGHSTLGIQEIAGRVGFVNPFHFSTRFRRFFGLTPSRYRANMRESGMPNDTSGE